MDIKLVDNNESLKVSDAIFGAQYNEPLIHQVVTAYLAAGRAGTHAQKNRSAVRGGGIKPWRQKGTGRARAGTIRSPLWRKGGVVFAAQPRSYEQKVNKRMHRGAMRSILSELLRMDRLTVTQSFDVDSPKTKLFINKLNALGLQGRVLIVTEVVEENLYLASRNIPTIDLRDVVAVDPVCLVKAEKVMMTSGALKQFEELLK